MKYTTLLGLTTMEPAEAGIRGHYRRARLQRIRLAYKAVTELRYKNEIASFDM